MKYEEYAGKIGFSKIGKVFVREIDGFSFYLKDWQYIILSIPSFYVALDRPIDKEEINKISKALFDTACSPYGLKEMGDTLIVSLPEGKKDSEKVIALINHQVEEVVRILKEDGYGPMKKCPLCGEEASYDAFGDNYCPIHEDCKTKYVEKIENKIKENNSKIGLCFLSIIVSTLFAGIGLLPALLLGIFSKDFFTGLVALIPVLNTLGYFLIKAPSNKILKFITGIIPFIIIVVFAIFILPYMAKENNLSFLDYCFTAGWVGFRKIIFMTILSFGGFGGVKFVSKFKIDYKKELEKLK